SETFLNDGRLPLRASCIAVAVAAFGTFTSKGRAFSTATRVNRTRTASDTDNPMAANVLAARVLIRFSTRTWTISVAAISPPLRYIVSQMEKTVNAGPTAAGPSAPA